MRISLDDINYNSNQIQNTDTAHLNEQSY
jgi:hypothetical protein